MSRDISFWKVKINHTIDNKIIYSKLSNEIYLEFLEDLPQKHIQLEFNNAFSDWAKCDSNFFEKENESFELMLTNQFVRVDYYGITEHRNH